MFFFLYGEDTYRSRQKLAELKNKFIREIDPGSSSLKVINGKAANFEEISDAVGSSSLLAKKRLIIIEELFYNKNQKIFELLFDYFKSKVFKNNENIIIFWESNIKAKKGKNREDLLSIDNTGREKALAKSPARLYKFLLEQKYSQQFNILSVSETTVWAKKEIANRGGKINNQALGALIGLAGNDLWQLNNDIDKLINFNNAKQPKIIDGQPVEVTGDDVKQLVKGNFDENIFALTDALSNKNKALAVKLLEEQSAAGLTDSYLLNMFIRQFKILLQIKQAVESGLTYRKIISLLKLHPFVAQKGISQAKNFSLTALKKIFKDLLEIDYLMKSGKAEAQTMLNILIAKI